MSSIQKTIYCLLNMGFNENELLNLLHKKNIKYELYNHDALFSVEESRLKRGEIKGSHSKNLFLKNKKNKFFLVSCLETTNINLKKLSKNLNLGNISFAKENYLMEYLGVMPGSVTPFGLINDKRNDVVFYLDKGFLSNDSLNFHPLTNTSTINLQTKDFINFLNDNKKKVNILDFKDYSVY